MAKTLDKYDLKNIEFLLDFMGKSIKVIEEVYVPEDTEGGISLKYDPDLGWILELYDAASFSYSAKWSAKNLKSLVRNLAKYPEGDEIPVKISTPFTLTLESDGAYRDEFGENFGKSLGEVALTLEREYIISAKEMEKVLKSLTAFGYSLVE